MRPRFVGRLGPADAVTTANAVAGFLAVLAAVAGDPALSARLILLAAVADGLDGVLARTLGGTTVGPLLDSLADVASFAVAPAVLVFAVAASGWGVEFGELSSRSVLAVAIPALYVAMAVVRLGLYTAFDEGDGHTEGVQSTLAATLLAVGYLAGLTAPRVLVGATAVFSYLMVTRLSYPGLSPRDALVMGGLQMLAVLTPTAAGRLFPRALLVAALAYLVGAPRFYRRGEE